LRPPAILTEACKLCSRDTPVTWMVILPSGLQKQNKFDTGIAMLVHVAQVHPEAVGLPSAEEQAKQYRADAYRRKLEKQLYERRN